MKKITLSSQSFEPFLKKIEELDRTKRLAICLLIILTLVFGFYFGIASSKLNAIKQYQNDYDATEKLLVVAKNKAAQLETLQNERKMKEMEFRQVMKALPEKKEIPSLLTSISQSGQDTGIEFISFEPKTEVSKDFYGEIPVDMDMVGGFHNTVMFFDKVTSLNRIVNIKNIQMVLSPPTKDEEKIKIKTKCQAVTYKFIEPGAADDIKNKAKTPVPAPVPKK